MVDEKPRLTASEIEEELLVELQKLPTLHDSIRDDSPVQRPEEFHMGAGRYRTGSGAYAEQVCRPGYGRRSIAAAIRP